MEMAAANVTTSNNEVQAEATDPEGSTSALPKAPVRKHRAKLESAELNIKSDVPPNKSDNLQTVIIISRVITDNSRVTAEISSIRPESSSKITEVPQIKTQTAVIQESVPIIIVEDLSINIDQKQTEPDDDRGKEDTNKVEVVVTQEVENIKTVSPKLPPKSRTVHPHEVKITPPKVKDGKSQVNMMNAAVKVFNKLMPSKKSSKVKPDINENIVDSRISDDVEINTNCENVVADSKTDELNEIISDKETKLNEKIKVNEPSTVICNEIINSDQQTKAINTMEINSEKDINMNETIVVQDISNNISHVKVKLNEEFSIPIESNKVSEEKQTTEEVKLIAPVTTISEKVVNVTEEIKAEVKSNEELSGKIESIKVTEEKKSTEEVQVIQPVTAISEKVVIVNEEIKTEVKFNEELSGGIVSNKVSEEKQSTEKIKVVEPVTIISEKVIDVNEEIKSEGIKEVTSNVENKVDDGKQTNSTKEVKPKSEISQTKIPQVKSKLIHQNKNIDTKTNSKDSTVSKKEKTPSVLNRLAKVVDDVKKYHSKDDNQQTKVTLLSQKKKSVEDSKSQQAVAKDDKVANGVNKITNHPKVESDATTLKKLRVTAEQLNQENTSLKKTLESERSAFREHKALHEAEMRKERAEAKRREGTLEGQLRSALKGVPPPSLGDGSAQADAAKLVSALQAVKSANKNLQDKLQVVTEADKRKVSEIRAQHDAHATQLQQMEREARAQTAKLLEELKTKERQLEQVKRGVRGVPPGGGFPKFPGKMAVADQLLAMEDQISRLETELMRRDDIIRSLRNSRGKRLPISRRASKENLLKDTVSDVDSAVSSAPNSLSPQPSPDLWFHSQEAARKEVDESLLEVQRRQIQELEKALNLSSVGQRTAQLRATQLEEQLQDLREHADLLEFRCLELEDTSEKRNSLEELTDSDSGCTSPEDRLKNSVSPQLRRSDSGYKSPTHQPTSPSLKNRRILSTPITSLSESESTPHAGKIHLQVNEHNLENGQQSDDIRDRLERMLVKTHTEADRNCLEQVLQLLWNLQALSSNLSDEDYSTIKNKKTIDNDSVKNDFEQTKTSKIIATISPYSQTSHKTTEITKSVSEDEPDLLNILIKEESKKLLYGLQESGIFDETDWDNKSTQTDWCDCVYTEPQSDLATEVQRLNQIREQLEKSGAIRSKSFSHKNLDGDIFIDCNQADTKQRRKLIDFYEKRNAILESKISIYESSEEVKEKKLAQRLQTEIDLQARVEILETDLDELQRKYIILEEERCEIEEEENDTRLHCQELEAEFELLSAKLRDMDEQRMCAKNESDCYRELVQEYEEKSICMQEQEKELKERLQIMEKTVPALIFWNICKFMNQYPEIDFKAAYQARLGKMSIMNSPARSEKCESDNHTESSKGTVCLECTGGSEDPFDCIQKQLEFLDSGKKVIQKHCKLQEEILRSRMAKLEKIIVESKETCMRQEEEANNRIKALEQELSIFKEKSLANSERNDTQMCTSETECAEKLQALIMREKEMKRHIEELEMKEATYLKTLNEGDEMWAEMEQCHKQKIKEYEDNESMLKEKIHKCESDRNKWRGICEPLEQKVRELEESEVALEAGLKKLQNESQSLVSMNADLSKHAENLKLQLNQSRAQSKVDIEGLKRELSIAKKVSEDVQTELKIQRSLHVDLESSHSARVTQMRREISKWSKDMLDLDVTNGELKEEVDTLENQVTELSNELTKQREEAEEKIKSLLEELSNKSKEVDELEREIADYQHLPSAHEELQQFDKSTSSKNCFNNAKICSCKNPTKFRTDGIVIEQSDPELHGECCCFIEACESIQKLDKSVMTDSIEEVIGERLPNKNYASIPNISTQSTQSGEGQNKQKPELPKRKPKATPKPHPLQRNGENKTNKPQKCCSEIKPSNESVQTLSKELAGSLLNIIDSNAKDNRKKQSVNQSSYSIEDKEKRDLEMSVFKTIHDSLKVYLDESAQPSSEELKQKILKISIYVKGMPLPNSTKYIAQLSEKITENEPEEPNVEIDKNTHSRIVSEEVMSPLVQKSVRLFEKACDSSNIAQNKNLTDEKLIKYTSYETPVFKKDTEETMNDSCSLTVKSGQKDSEKSIKVPPRASSRKLISNSHGSKSNIAGTCCNTLQNSKSKPSEVCKPGSSQKNKKNGCPARCCLSKRQSLIALAGKCSPCKPQCKARCSKIVKPLRVFVDNENEKNSIKMNLKDEVIDGSQVISNKPSNQFETVEKFSDILINDDERKIKETDTKPIEPSQTESLENNQNLSSKKSSVTTAIDEIGNGSETSNQNTLKRVSSNLVIKLSIHEDVSCSTETENPSKHSEEVKKSNQSISIANDYKEDIPEYVLDLIFNFDTKDNSSTQSKTSESLSSNCEGDLEILNEISDNSKADIILHIDDLTKSGCDISEPKSTKESSIEEVFEIIENFDEKIPTVPYPDKTDSLESNSSEQEISNDSVEIKIIFVSANELESQTANGDDEISTNLEEVNSLQSQSITKKKAYKSCTCKRKKRINEPPLNYVVEVESNSPSNLIELEKDAENDSQISLLELSNTESKPKDETLISSNGSCTSVIKKSTIEDISTLSIPKDIESKDENIPPKVISDMSVPESFISDENFSDSSMAKVDVETIKVASESKDEILKSKGSSPVSLIHQESTTAEVTTSLSVENIPNASSTTEPKESSLISETTVVANVSDDESLKSKESSPVSLIHKESTTPEVVTTSLSVENIPNPSSTTQPKEISLISQTTVVANVSDDESLKSKESFPVSLIHKESTTAEVTTSLSVENIPNASSTTEPKKSSLISETTVVANVSDDESLKSKESFPVSLIHKESTTPEVVTTSLSVENIPNPSSTTQPKEISLISQTTVVANVSDDESLKSKESFPVSLIHKESTTAEVTTSLSVESIPNASSTTEPKESSLISETTVVANVSDDESLKSKESSPISLIHKESTTAEVTTSLSVESIPNASSTTEPKESSLTSEPIVVANVTDDESLKSEDSSLEPEKKDSSMTLEVIATSLSNKDISNILSTTISREGTSKSFSHSNSESINDKYQSKDIENNETGTSIEGQVVKQNEDSMILTEETIDNIDQNVPNETISCNCQIGLPIDKVESSYIDMKSNSCQCLNIKPLEEATTSGALPVEQPKNQYPQALILPLKICRSEARRNKKNVSATNQRKPCDVKCHKKECTKELEAIQLISDFSFNVLKKDITYKYCGCRKRLSSLPRPSDNKQTGSSTSPLKTQVSPSRIICHCRSDLVTKDTGNTSQNIAVRPCIQNVSPTVIDSFKPKVKKQSNSKKRTSMCEAKKCQRLKSCSNSKRSITDMAFGSKTSRFKLQSFLSKDNSKFSRDTEKADQRTIETLSSVNQQVKTALKRMKSISFSEKETS